MKDLPEEQQAEIGERIRRVRKHRGKTQVKFAEELGVATSELARIEIGYNPVPDDLLEHISKSLEVERKWLLTGEGRSPEPQDDRRISGARIRKLRESLGLSREELSSRIGVKPSTLHNVELGHQRLGPAATTALKNLALQNNESGVFKMDDRVVDVIIDKAIEETYRVMEDESAMKAVESLTQTLGDDRLTILKNLVKNKVRGSTPQKGGKSS